MRLRIGPGVNFPGARMQAARYSFGRVARNEERRATAGRGPATGGRAHLRARPPADYRSAACRHGSVASASSWLLRQLLLKTALVDVEALTRRHAGDRE